MADEHFYLGIDLGTTNSSVHWGSIHPHSGLVEPSEIAFDQLIADGTTSRRALLRSLIWFKPDGSVEIGDYARMGLRAQASRVARSVKNHMGDRNWAFEVDGNRYTAAQLSAMILRRLAAGIQQSWGLQIDDVVIAVPASFDGDMRADTIEAARLAGFKVEEKDGSPRSLLIDEPRAALYDLINQQRAGRIPAAVIDFSSPQTVMVFDLGGGTLDVSLHRVERVPNSLEISVEDIAISRYTQLGGDQFDELLAREFLARFIERHKLDYEGLAPQDQNLIWVNMLAAAEQAKQSLTAQIDRHLMTSPVDYGSLPGHLGVDVQVPFIFDDKGLFTRLTREEYDAVIAPLLGWELQVGNYQDTEELDYQSAGNIIFPVLDVLNKAHKRLGAEPTIDMVLLNGGMTRVHAVKNRIEQLLGIRPLTVLDPDKSVSRGAAVYHYLLHKGFRPKAILAETIGVAVAGNRIRHLVPAGTVLPTRMQFDDFAVPADDVTIIDLPLYRGESKQVQSANKPLIRRAFRLSSPQPQGTPITVEINIDDNKIVTFKAWLTNNQSEKVEIEVHAENAIFQGNGSRKPVRQFQPQVLTEPMGPPVDPLLIRRRIRLAANQNDIQEFKQIQKEVLSAKNAEDGIRVVLDEIDTTTTLGKERLLIILGEFSRRYPESTLLPNIIQKCIALSTGMHKRSDIYIKTVGRQAAVALGKIGRPIAEGHLIGLLGYNVARTDAIFSIGKCGDSMNAVSHLVRYATSGGDGERIAVMWALGKLISRERERPLPIQALLDLKLDEVLIQRVHRKIETHVAARKFAVYALGELCDRRPCLGHSDIVDDELAQAIILHLRKVKQEATHPHPGENLSELLQIQQLADTAIMMAEGKELGHDEQYALMAVRSFMGSSE